jgi:cupin 2 domain-containing protein
MANLFDALPNSLPQEFVEALACGEHVRIERIVTTGQMSPEGFWYDQEESEWVAVLSGKAKLRFDGDLEPITLSPGDHVLIPAHRKHRVEWTSPDEPTVWLAVFFSS